MFFKIANVNHSWRDCSLVNLLNPQNNLKEEINKEIADAHSEKAKKLFYQKKYKEALFYYSESIQLFKTNSRTYSNRSACHLLLKNYQQSFDDINNSIELDPTWFKSFLRKSILLKRTGHPEEARENLLKAMELSGDTNLSKMFENDKFQTKFIFKDRKSEITFEFSPKQSEFYVADISSVSNLCYIPVDKFLKKFDYCVGSETLNFTLTASFVFDDFMLLKVSKKNPKIQILKINGCSMISETGLKYCLENYLFDLKYLDVRNIKNIHTTFVESLEKKNKKLEVMHSCFSKTDVFGDVDIVIYFKGKGTELSDIFELNKNQLSGGIPLSELCSMFKLKSIQWHPDLNSFNYLMNKNKLTTMNDLMKDLLQKVEFIETESFEYEGKSVQTEILEIRN
jgi:tetratricopeptide (TPR) repeat protein